jgi:hypothetical protein
LLLNNKIQTKVVTVVISSLIGLYLAEGGLNYLNFGPLEKNPYAIAEMNGVEFDFRSKLEVIEDLIESGKDAVPSIAVSELLPIIGMNEDSFDSLLPLGGLSKKITVGPNESGKHMIFRSDRYGFNNPDAEWDSQPIEWLLLGDSFMNGVAVEQGQEIAGQLRLITGNHLISLGNNGNGPLLEYATLVEYGKKLMPEKVIWTYYEGNDFFNLNNEKVNTILMKYMEDGFSQNLLNRQKDVDLRLSKYVQTGLKNTLQKREKDNISQEKLYKYRWIRLYEVRKILSSLIKAKNIKVDVQIDDVLLAEILTKAEKKVRSWGGELFFVYLPGYERYNSNFIAHDTFRQKNKVIETVKNIGIHVIDIHNEVFEAHHDPLSLFPFRLDNHYSSEGYSLVAKAIMTSVLKYETSLELIEL